MAKFLFMSNGYFVNVDMITAMRIRGTIGQLDWIEIWFMGSDSREHAGLIFKRKEADELFEELIKVHKMIGWTPGEGEVQPTSEQPTED
jgi:hypothetical protein